jgi:hypothetical protein
MPSLSAARQRYFGGSARPFWYDDVTVTGGTSTVGPPTLVGWPDVPRHDRNVGVGLTRRCKEPQAHFSEGLVRRLSG